MTHKNHFTIDEVRAFWDSVAEIYDRMNKKIGPAHFQRFTESLKYLKLKDGDRVLNIWSRTGNAVTYLEQAARLELYNLEVSPKMMAKAEKKYPHANFSLTDLHKLAFSDNFFDAILSLETLEHAPDPQILLDEFYRVLKPGKRLVMSLPPKTAELPLRIFETFFDNHGEGPHRFMPSKEVKNLLGETGFKLKLHKGTLLIPAGPALLQKFGEMVIDLFQKTPLSELGIRQFYVCEKYSYIKNCHK